MSSPPGTTLRVPTLPGHDFNLPQVLEGLDDLAYNLWWSWTPRAGALFSRLDPAAWARHRNPIAVLAGMDAGRWEVASADEEFLVDASRLLDEYHRYMGNGSDSWYQQQIAANPGSALPGPIALLLCRVRLPRVDADLLRVAWASWPATIASRRPMRPCPSSAWASCTAVAISVSRLMPMGTRSTRSRTWTHRCCRCAAREPPTAPRCRSASTSPTARCMPRSGWRRSAASRSCCWTRISPPTPGRTGPSPTSCTCAAARCASARS